MSWEGEYISFGYPEAVKSVSIFKGIKLINYTENHQKYWEAHYDKQKNVLIREWGRVGNAPQHKEESCSVVEAVVKIEKLVLDKYTKGYRTEEENLKFLLNKS